MRRTLFTNVSVFDGTGAMPFPAQVRVDGSRIGAVAAACERVEADGALVVDGKGSILMPGLTEAHAHLSFPSSTDRIVNAMHLPARFEIALRKEIDGGWLPGPRLRASSIEKAPNADLGLPQSHDVGHEGGPDGIRRFVKAMADEGVDSIKFLLSGDEGFAPGGSHVLTYSEDEAAAAGEAARDHGVWLACHAQAAEAVKMAVRHGFRSIYHCSYADEEALDLLESRKDQIFVAPAPGLLYARMYEAEAFGIDRATAERMGARSGLELMQVLYPKMRSRGIRVLPGGDYGFPYNPIGKNARDFELFVKLFGYSPIETLVAATKHGGELMGMGDELGLIREGYLADLLLVKGDPTEDVTLLQNQDNLLAIMKDGAFWKPPRGAAV